MVGRYLRLLRPGDWTKNILVLPALVFARKLGDVQAEIHTAVALVAFIALSCGFYCLNDAVDVNEDRAHPVKRKRPVAAGEISPASAAILGTALIVFGIVAGFCVNRFLGLTCLLYVALQLAYNIKLKRVMMVDVTTVALGFVLRAAAGAAAISIQLSIWLALCVFFLCLYLGLIKRLCDLTSAQRASLETSDPGSQSWHSAAGYESGIELSWLLAVSGVLAVMTYLLYTLSGHAAELFGNGAIGLALLTPLVVIAVHRFYRRAISGLSDRPIEAILRDRVIRTCVLLFAFGVLVSVYLPSARVWLGILFVK